MLEESANWLIGSNIGMSKIRYISSVANKGNANIERTNEEFNSYVRMLCIVGNIFKTIFLLIDIITPLMK